MLFRSLVGKSGQDSFLFNTGGGNDTVVDFQNGIDRIQITNGAESFAEILVTDSNANVVIQFSNVTITLLNVDHSLIGIEDFLFV